MRLKDIMKRKIADVRLMPNDILIVPDSLGLKALYKTGEIATTVGTGILIYRHLAGADSIIPIRISESEIPRREWKKQTD